MSKYCGKIGFLISEETAPGVYMPEIIEKLVYGDAIRITKRNQSQDKVNDDISISSQLSILLDPFVEENFYYIKYAEYMGFKWKVESIEVQFPRLILNLGGKYNE